LPESVLRHRRIAPHPRLIQNGADLFHPVEQPRRGAWFCLPYWKIRPAWVWPIQSPSCTSSYRSFNGLVYLP